MTCSREREVMVCRGPVELFLGDLHLGDKKISTDRRQNRFVQRISLECRRKQVLWLILLEHLKMLPRDDLQPRLIPLQTL